MFLALRCEIESGGPSMQHLLYRMRVYGPEALVEGASLRSQGYGLSLLHNEDCGSNHGPDHQHGGVE